MRADKEVKVIHFEGGGKLIVDHYEAECSHEVTTFSGRTIHLHRVKYPGGEEGYVTDEQVESVETKTRITYKD